MKDFLDTAWAYLREFRYTKEPALVFINRDMESDLHDYAMKTGDLLSFTPKMTIHDKPLLFGIPVVWGDEFEIL